MNKRLTFLYFAVVLTAGIFVACSGGQADANAAPEIVADPGEDTTSREFGYFERSEQNPFDNKILGAYKLAKKSWNVEFFAKTYRGVFFLSKNNEDLYADNGINKKVRFGLIGAKSKRLLNTEFESIGNPGLILDDYMEVKKDGKYGLYNYAEERLIPAEYDAIYPSKIVAYIAIGQKGSSFYKIYADGTSKPFGDHQPAPNYIRLLREYRFNLESEHYGLWISAEPLDYYEPGEGFPDYANGLLFPPSYLMRLKLFPDAVNQVNIGWAGNDGDSLDLNLVSVKKRNDDVTALVTSFFYYATESRGYENTQRYLVTLDRKNTVKASKELLNYSNYAFEDACASEWMQPTVRFLNDSIVEVRNYVSESSDTNTIPYFAYTKYEHYQILADGTVKTLGSGIFPMTAAVVLTRDHFKGSFSRSLYGEEAMKTELYESPDPEDSEVYQLPIYACTNQLSANDLEYMRNEIYARHGFKFKDQKWAALFKSFKWYKATRSNVDALLTPIEKKNLQLIKQLEKELRSNPEAIHEEYDYIFQGG